SGSLEDDGERSGTQAPRHLEATRLMVRTQDGDRDGATVAAYDIARLAGVGRAAVSNWRRRYPDFPKPVGGSAASPLYALSEVREWLARHGRRFQLAPGDRVWQHVRGTVPDL